MIFVNHLNNFNQMKKIFLLCFISLLFLGCDSGKVYQRYEDLTGNRWARENVVSFEVNIEDAAPEYDVILAVRHSTYYLFADLMVNLTAIYPSGEERTKDYDFFVKEDDGSFKGEGAGDLWDIEFPMLEKVKFPEKGKYTFKVSNIMPIPETGDILQIGLIVRKSES
jgi:gliding motility-associated lipoprotein GldH